MEDDADTLGDEKGPERTCIVTRQKGDPSGLIRFVVGPDGCVVPDIRAKLPGRGAWVLADAETVALAVKRKSFTRAFKQEMRFASPLVEQVDDLLQRDALQALAFANKAGQVVAGSMKVETALARNALAGLIHAADGSADGVRKIEAAARRAIGDRRDKMARVQIFVSSQLDLALGRSNVIHAGLLTGGVSDAFFTRAARLERFRGASPNGAAETSGNAALNET
ncbi:RNA-binding protein [Lichenihabitans psoromatis]|uniref:RNA-binding protein n=1 Tax=Lichenihabitans psoromatis TaxID=2528642 RepID=UPI0010384A76|nr:RNA-binding protein [Lichenihabitans psoromatis]